MWEFINYNYTSTNLPNVFVSYNEERFIKISPNSEAFITEGTCEVYCKIRHEYEKNIVPIHQEAKIENKTKYPVYVKLNDCVLTNEREGDFTLTILPRVVK